MANSLDPNSVANKYSSTEYINQKTLAEIAAFTGNNGQLRADIEHVFSIGVPHRGKTSLMFEFGKALSVDQEKLTPFAIGAELMMAAAMNDDDIIDNNDLRYGKPPLYITRGVPTAIMVTGYMYALIFSILKKYRPEPSSKIFNHYLKAEEALLEYFLVMHEAQYLTTTQGFDYESFTLDDLRNLAQKKASLLFQFCTSVPSYLASIPTSDFEAFGNLYGIAVQYKSDIRDFKFDPNDTDKNKLRLEDYYTGQPNLVLLFTVKSEELEREDHEWLTKTWSRPNQSASEETNEKVFDLILQSGALEAAGAHMLEIKKELESYIAKFPTEELKSYLTKLVIGVCTM